MNFGIKSSISPLFFAEKTFFIKIIRQYHSLENFGSFFPMKITVRGAFLINCGI